MTARLAITKRAKAVAALPIVTALATLAVVELIPDRYTASVLIQVDPRESAPAASNASKPALVRAFEDQRLAVEKQIELLRSPALIDGVADAFHLYADAEFQKRPLLSRISSPFENADPQTITRDALADRLTVRRVRNSSLIRVLFTSRDPVKSAQLANAIVKAYIAQKRPGAVVEESEKQSRTKQTASEQVFASLLDQYGSRQSLSAARIVEAARPPQQPAGPKRARIVATVAASTLIMMLVIALLLERDARLRTRKVEKMLACPHMTSLPAVLSDEDAHMPARNARLIVAEPKCRYADAVRSACHELNARASGDGPRIILVASALSDEGAELFASNIAHHFAVAGQKSLLADCDFRANELTRQLAPQSTSGFFDQIAVHGAVENAILRDSLTGVYFLPASGPTPIALSVTATLRSSEFSTALLHLKSRFRTIVVSAPPLLTAADAQALAELADQIVFLTAWHRTPRLLARKALTLLGANQQKVVGAVLTDITDEKDAGFMSFAEIFDEIRRATRMPSLERAA